MAVHNNSSEEDYLDSLLNAVLNDSPDNKQKELNNDEEILGEIEDDLFDGDMSSAEALNFDEALSDRPHSDEKPKKEKKGFFGRRNKNKKKPVKEVKTDVDFGDVADDALLDREVEEDKNLFEESINNEVTKAADEKVSEPVFEPVPEPVSEPEESYIEPPDFMEDLLGNSTSEGEELSEEDTFSDMGMLSDHIPEGYGMPEEENSSSIEEDMQGLYDILGVHDAEEEGASDEISRLENEKSGKKKRREKKAKKEKKAGFGRRKKSKDNKLSDEELELAMSFSDDGSGSNEEMPDNGFDMEDMGLGGLEDIFMGGEESGDSGMTDEEMGMSDDFDSEYPSEEDKPKKEKKKKEKKEKKKKEKKPKKEKPKKEKKKKEKKPKKPKQPDEMIHIPKPFIIFCISLIVLLVVGLKLGGNYRNYMERTDAALSYYLNKDFEAAYDELRGLEMNENDQNFYNQVETIMYVQRHYTSYKSLYSLEKYDQALHTLLRGVKMYDKYKDTAREYNCYDDMTLVLGWIDSALQEKYGITESEARELNLIEDQYEYAERVYKLADEAEAREKALKAEAENSGQTQDNTSNGQ